MIWDLLGCSRAGWGWLESPLASASADRASVFIKAQPVCMTATEMLVSSRLMKTDDSPHRDAVTRNKKHKDKLAEESKKEKIKKRTVPHHLQLFVHS